MTDSIPLLQELGFTEYEARAYQLLLQHNPATGYELAKISGIPRPNIYPVMQKLEEHGAVVRIASEDDTTRYLPIPPEELLKTLEEHLHATLNRVGPLLKTTVQPADANYIWHTKGYSNLLAQARTLINGTQADLLIALWPEEAHALAEELELARLREVNITTLCLAACPQECGGCQGQIFCHKVAGALGPRCLLLVPDHKELLAGEFAADSEVSVVRTRQTLFINLISWFIQQTVILGLLVQNMGGDLEKYLTAEAKAMLSKTHWEVNGQRTES